MEMQGLFSVKTSNSVSLPYEWNKWQKILFLQIQKKHLIKFKSFNTKNTPQIRNRGKFPRPKGIYKKAMIYVFSGENLTND